MYRLALPFPSSQKKLYCSFAGISLRISWATSFQERLDITERAAAGQSDPAIAAALGCSVWTVRKWRRRGQHRGRSGLSSHMGRPTSGPLSTLPAGMRDAILQMRRTHPGWGPNTLLAELRVDSRWADHPLPSRSRIAVLLKAEKLTRDYQKHSDLPSPPSQPQGAPHDEWEIDAQGRMHIAGVGKVSLITIIDVVSRLKVESYPCLETTNPPFSAYPLMLRRAFLTVGLPRRISLDHGTVFYDNTSPSPFPIHLHLWLLALGIDVCFTRKRCPTDHAKIERTHQTITAQALLGQAYPSPSALWVGLDGRRAMRESAYSQSGLTGSRSLTGLSRSCALRSLVSPGMGSGDARPESCLCLFDALSLVPAHTRQRAAGSGWL